MDYIFNKRTLTHGIVSWENLEGGQESSHHSAEAYRQQVRDYLESMEYLESGEQYSGVADITLTRPAHNEEKEFRVETKNTKASLTDEGLCTEIARHFIDYCVHDHEFELYIFAHDYAYQQKKWRATFHERHRKEETVKEFYHEVRENSNLTESEEEKLERLDYDEFVEFIGKVGVKKAGYERLIELTEENKKQNRRRKKWDFYVTERDPVPKDGELIPNFVRISDYPDSVWVIPSQGVTYNDLLDIEGLPKCIPVWVEQGQAFSLLSPHYLPDSLPSRMAIERGEQRRFSDWLKNEGDNEVMIKILLAKKIAWRALQIHSSCTVIADRKVIIQSDNSVQGTLTGNKQEGEDPNRTQISLQSQSYVVSRRVDDAVGHRYCKPRIKEYDDGHYLFLETGWVFSKNGRGDNIIDGDWATRLHHSLRKQGYDQHNNYRAQLRFWKRYLRLGVGEETPLDTPGIDPDQKMYFSSPGELTLTVRPPEDSEERDDLIEGDRIADQ